VVNTKGLLVTCTNSHKKILIYSYLLICIQYLHTCIYCSSIGSSSLQQVDAIDDIWNKGTCSAVYNCCCCQSPMIQHTVFKISAYKIIIQWHSDMVRALDCKVFLMTACVGHHYQAVKHDGQPSTSCAVN